MEDAADGAVRTTRPTQEGGRDGIMRIAIMDENGSRQLGSEPQLAVHGIPLHVGRRQVSEVVQADLANRRAARVAGKRLERSPLGLPRCGGMVRMDADRGLHRSAVPIRKRERVLRRPKIPPGDHQTLEPRGARAFHDGVAVRVEALVL